MIDVTTDGAISKLELLKFFTGGEQDPERKRIMGVLVSELMSIIDADGSGEVTYGEWVDQVSNNDDCWNIFIALSPLTKFVESIQKAGRYVLPY